MEFLLSEALWKGRGGGAFRLGGEPSFVWKGAARGHEIHGLGREDIKRNTSYAIRGCMGRKDWSRKRPSGWGKTSQRGGYAHEFVGWT